MNVLIKINNNWKDASKIFKKESGAWVEIDVNNLSQYASQNIFLYGGYEESGPEHSGGQYDPSSYDTEGSKFKAWSYFSPTGRDSNYSKNRNVVTFDLIFTSDKKFTLIINDKATDYENYSFAPDFDNVSIKIGTGIPDFTINELSVTK